MKSCEPDERVDAARRSLCGSTAACFAASWIGASGVSSADFSNAMELPKAHPALSFTSLKHVSAGELDVSYAELGPIDGPPVILLHGWPYDIHSFAESAPILAAMGLRVIIPYVRGFGSTRFLSADAVRNGQPAALAVDVIDLMDALDLERATLAGFDWGARTAGIVAALWPSRVAGVVAVSGYLIGNQAAGKVPLEPEAELRWWYQFYFATERGRLGYKRNRREFANLIWRLASPQWQFDAATFQRSAPAFDNPDHVDVVVHNYRWRLGLASGEARFDKIEQRLAESPLISVPTITLEGDANGAPHPEPGAYARKFSGAYEHRTIRFGVGHNLPQEAPEAFARAVIDVSALEKRAFSQAFHDGNTRCNRVGGTHGRSTLVSPPDLAKIQVART